VNLTREQGRAHVQSLVRDFGSWSAFDHSLYTVTELDREVVMLALDLGWSLDDSSALQLAALIDFTNPVWDEKPQDSAQMLGWFHEEAIDYLNEHVCPDGWVWEHDGHAGAFGCWRITEGYLA